MQVLHFKDRVGGQWGWGGEGIKWGNNICEIIGVKGEGGIMKLWRDRAYEEVYKTRISSVVEGIIITTGKGG